MILTSKTNCEYISRKISQTLQTLHLMQLKSKRLILCVDIIHAALLSISFSELTVHTVHVYCTVTVRLSIQLYFILFYSILLYAILFLAAKPASLNSGASDKNNISNAKLADHSISAPLNTLSLTFPKMNFLTVEMSACF